MRQKEIWRVHLPDTPTREQKGERPAVIIQTDFYIGPVPLVLIVPMTGEVNATRYDGTLLIQPDATNGLTKPSVALVFQTPGLDNRRFIRCMGVLDDENFNTILDWLDKLTGRTS